MNTNLIQIRVKAFLVQAGSLIGVALVGVFLSPDFKNLVIQNFGTGFSTSLIMLVVTGVVSHFSNLMAIKKAAGLGSSADTAGVILI